MYKKYIKDSLVWIAIIMLLINIGIYYSHKHEEKVNNIKYISHQKQLKETTQYSRFNYMTVKCGEAASLVNLYVNNNSSYGAFVNSASYIKLRNISFIYNKQIAPICNQLNITKPITKSEKDHLNGSLHILLSLTLGDSK